MKNIKIMSVLSASLIFWFFNFVHAEIIPPIPDTILPVITLLGDAEIHIAQNSTYTDAGATALDDIDGDITLNIITTNSVDTVIPATYTVTYNISDVAGNVATPITRTVIVDAQVPDPVTPTPTETFIIRDGATIIYQDSIPLPDAGTISLIDKNGTSHNVDARSVLAILSSIDSLSDAFSISDLEYYDSFGAFYLKCITPENSTGKCDNWQYAVGSSTPWTSIDTTILSGGETIGLYFGSPHQIIFDKTAITVGESFTATAQKYNYTDNTWSPLTEVNVGVTQPNLNDPWDPIVITTGAVDVNGSTIFTLTNTGTYNVGITEDYYFPSYVITANSAQTVGGGGPILTPSFNVSNALAYLKQIQMSDGSFGGSAMYTDWAAIAYGAANVSDNSRDLLIEYLRTHTISSSMLTDNERRAMAILALGQNPYLFNGTNYIDTIIRSFDGIQFGDQNLINDDIFALIPLTAAGYSETDEVIIKDIAFLLSRENSDGSWEGSIDLTAAAIQALVPFTGVTGVSEAISKAKDYITNTQGENGGWNSVYSTSWVLQAGNATNTSWTKNGHTGIDFLITNQFSDGAVLSNEESLQNRIWATSYAIPAVLGKSWSDILYPVSNPTQENTLVNINGYIDNSQNVLSETEANKIVPEPISPPREIKIDDVVSPEQKVSIMKSSASGKKVVTAVTVIPEPIIVSEKDFISQTELTASATNSAPKISGSVVLGVGIIFTGIFFFRRFVSTR